MDNPAGQVSQFPRPPLEYAAEYSNEAVANESIPPPPAPIDGHYIMFGQNVSTDDPLIMSLDTQGVKQLYSSTADSRGELKRLTRSLVAAYLDLVEILIRCPESPERQKKLEDIRLLFFNTHHLINEYRPQQARETVQLMLDIQQRDRQNIIDRFDTISKNTAEKLQKCAAKLKELDLSLPDDLLEEIAACTSDYSDKQSTSTSKSGTNKTDATNLDEIMCRICDQGKS